MRPAPQCGAERTGRVDRTVVDRDAHEIKIGSHIDKPVEESGADGCADELRDDVAAEFTEFHATRQQHCKRYGRVDMTARDIADAIYKTQ